MPAKVVKIINDHCAQIIQNNKKRKIKTTLVEDIKINDWVLTNANMAVSKITATEANIISSYYKKNVK